MWVSMMVSVLTLVFAVGSASPIDGDGGICATAGRICGDVPCVPHSEGEYFTCDCGPDQYFNATAQRCYHVRSCMTKPCREGICRDNDGRSARMCDCSNIKHLKRDCTVERAFAEACLKYYGGTQRNEQGEWVCICPFGTKFNGFGCESYACGLPKLSCQNICNYKPYSEDKRCCQGWDNGCDAYYMEGTYCKPGTIPAGKNQNNLNCTNVCAMGQDACEYYCTYKDAKSPYYTCTCPDGKVLNADGYTCREKKKCEDHEESDCRNRGQRCVVEERRAVCKCPSGQILFNGGCRASCTPAKTATCATILSHCEIIDDVETCVCDSPLIWDEAEKKCLLEKQFVYEMHFEMNKHPKVEFEEWLENAALKIQRAMENLYGTSLRKTKFNQRGRTSVIELSFSDEPEKALLNRIFQCQEFEAPEKCFFAPNLYIINGTATTATSIDLCDRYLGASSPATKHGLECHNEGKGEYSLRCRGKNSQPPAKYGALTVVRCDGVCATAGRICGPARCVLQDGGLHFTCECGKDQYFNATAQRCYHIGNCITNPCPSGICQDNDGQSARTCDCSNIKHLTKDCKVEETFHKACSKYKAGVGRNEEGEIVCTCPFGMKFNGEDCESYACGVSGFSCQQICNYKPYREDQRCCQGWDISCDARYEENTYCKPGTIPAGKDPKNLNCTNICAMGQSPCEHDCTYTDPKSPYFACTCPEGDVISDHGYTCRAKTECDDHEKEECTKKGQRCVVENRRAVCKCPAEQVLVDGVCRASCTEPKKSTCATILSQCKIIDNVETCVCDSPLIWNEAEKKCVLERQFIYQMQFEMDQHPTVHTQAWCDDAEIEIDHAMKNLYGKSLRRAELVQCGGTPTIEMNFAEEPDKALLNRIFQCQEHDSPDKCYFAPDLYIVKGTVKAPASIDTCSRYLQKSSLFEKEGLKCQNDGNGEYSLRCRGKNSLPPAKYGALTVVQCEDQSLCTEEKRKECERDGRECVVKQNEPRCERPPRGDVSTRQTPSPETAKPTLTRPTVPPNGGPNAAVRFTSTTGALLIGVLIPAVLV